MRNGAGQVHPVENSQFHTSQASFLRTEEEDEMRISQLEAEQVNQTYQFNFEAKEKEEIVDS